MSLLYLIRYGHASVKLKDQLVIYGGFGLKGHNQVHSRLTNLVVLKRLSTGQWNSQEMTTLSECQPGMFHKYKSMSLITSY